MIELRIPGVGRDTGEIQLVEWTAASGDTVERGQTIFTIESDKSVVEIEAPIGGVLRILLPAGIVYPIDELIGRIE